MTSPSKHIFSQAIAETKGGGPGSLTARKVGNMRVGKQMPPSQVNLDDSSVQNDAPFAASINNKDVSNETIKIIGEEEEDIRPVPDMKQTNHSRGGSLYAQAKSDFIKAAPRN
jgi:hypothetical protein